MIFFVVLTLAAGIVETLDPDQAHGAVLALLGVTGWMVWS